MMLSNMSENSIHHGSIPLGLYFRISPLCSNVGIEFFLGHAQDVLTGKEVSHSFKESGVIAKSIRKREGISEDRLLNDRSLVTIKKGVVLGIGRRGGEECLRHIVLVGLTELVNPLSRECVLIHEAGSLALDATESGIHGFAFSGYVVSWS